MTSAGMRQTRPSAPRPRPTAASRSAVPSVRVAPTTAANRAGGTGFMWLVAIIALGSAMCLLLLNTLRSEQSFTVTTLQKQVAVLDDQQQALDSDISALSAPEALALKADGMGMVHARSVKFVRRADGKVLGVATSPQAGTSIAVNTGPQSAASAAASEVLASGLVGNHVGNAPAPKASTTPSAGTGAITKTPAVTKKHLSQVLTPGVKASILPTAKHASHQHLRIRPSTTKHTTKK